MKIKKASPNISVKKKVKEIIRKQFNIDKVIFSTLNSQNFNKNNVQNGRNSEER